MKNSNQNIELTTELLAPIIDVYEKTIKQVEQSSMRQSKYQQLLLEIICTLLLFKKSSDNYKKRFSEFSKSKKNAKNQIKVAE